MDRRCFGSSRMNGAMRSHRTRSQYCFGLAGVCRATCQPPFPTPPLLVRNDLLQAGLMSAMGGKQTLAASEGSLYRFCWDAFILRPTNQIFGVMAVYRFIRTEERDKRSKRALLGER